MRGSLRRKISRKVTFSTNSDHSYDFGGREVCASRIRGILLDDLRNPSIRFVRVSNVQIKGDIDLEGLRIEGSVEFGNVGFSGGLKLKDAEVRSIIFTGCRLGGICAEQCEILGRLVFRDGTDSRTISLAQIDLSRCLVRGNVEFAGFKALDCKCSAVVAAGAKILGSFYMGDGFVVEGNCTGGVVNLERTDLGTLVAAGSFIMNNSGSSLKADRAKIRHDVLLGPGFRSVGAGEHGGFRLVGGEIGGDLDCRGASFTSIEPVAGPGLRTGPAFEAGQLTVANHVFLSEGFRAESNSHHATVNAPGIKVGGVLDFRTGWVANDGDHSAIKLDQSEIGGTVYLSQGFRASGGSMAPAVVLTGARIGGALEALGGRIESQSSLALDLTGSQVAGQLRMDKFVACKEETLSSTDLTSLHGELPAWAKIEDPRNPAWVEMINAGYEELGHVWPVKNGPGRSREQWMGWLCRTEEWKPLGRVQLSFCKYGGAPTHVAPHELLEWLADPDRAYDSSAYHELAASYDRAGSSANALKVRIAHQREYIRRSQVNRMRKLWWRTLGVLTGYGYKPARAIHWMAGLVAISVIFCFSLGGSWIVVAGQSGVPTHEQPCAPSRIVKYAVSIALPIVAGNSDKVCQVRSGEGLGLSALAVGETAVEVAGWILASVFVAGIVGITRPRDW